MKWRYSLRWKLPHRPCPGPRELISGADSSACVYGYRYRRMKLC